MNFKEYLSESITESTKINNMRDVIKVLGKGLPDDDTLRSFLKKYFDVDKSNFEDGTGDENTDNLLGDIMMQYRTDVSDLYESESVNEAVKKRKKKK